MTKPTRWVRPGLLGEDQHRVKVRPKFVNALDFVRHHDIEFLIGPVQRVYAPRGRDAALFAFSAGMTEPEREYIREKADRKQARHHLGRELGPASFTADSPS